MHLYTHNLLKYPVISLWLVCTSLCFLFSYIVLCPWWQNAANGKWATVTVYNVQHSTAQHSTSVTNWTQIWTAYTERKHRCIPQPKKNEPQKKISGNETHEFLINDPKWFASLLLGNSIDKNQIHRIQQQKKATWTELRKKLKAHSYTYI